jgi:hypothetical protein
MSVDECRKALGEAVTRLQPVLQPLGFNFDGSESGQAHMPFAAGFFIGDAMKIGLIFRQRGTLGSVNYENEVSNMSHDDLLRSLGAQDRQRLIYDDAAMASRAKDGGDPLDALVYDWRELVGERLTDRELMSESIAASLRKRLEEWMPSTTSGATPSQETTVPQWWIRLLDRLRWRK